MTPGPGGGDAPAPQAAREAYDALYRAVLPLARRYTGSEDGAWDIVEEVMTRCLGKGVDPLGTDRGLLRVAAKRLALNAHRGTGRERKAMKKWVVERPFFRSPIPTPAQVLDETRTRELIELVLAMLPKGQREALLLTKGTGMTCKEAAAVLGCSEANVKNQVQRAKDRARATLRDMGIECLDDV